MYMCIYTYYPKFPRRDSEPKRRLRENRAAIHVKDTNSRGPMASRCFLDIYIYMYDMCMYKNITYYIIYYTILYYNIISYHAT